MQTSLPLLRYRLARRLPLGRRSGLASLVRGVEALARAWAVLPRRRVRRSRADVRSATERYVLYFMLPAWLVPGLVDWAFHRRTRIEETSGTRESAVHALMMSEVGVPVVLGLLFEINPLVLAIMIGHAFAHEATAVWDVNLAVRGGRQVKPNEQHVHSFLEVLPFMAVSSMMCLHWDQLRAMVGLERGEWRLRLKTPRLSTRYLAAIGAAIAAFLALPYGEELVRCVRAERARGERGERGEGVMAARPIVPARVAKALEGLAPLAPDGAHTA